MIDLGNAKIGKIKTDELTAIEFTEKQTITVTSDQIKINGKLVESGTYELNDGDTLEFYGGEFIAKDNKDEN